MNQSNEMVFGYEKGNLNNIEYFYAMVTELKRIKRTVVTNFYMNTQRLKESIHRGEVKYEYKYGRYLNLIITDDGFSRLYYYIADTNDYHFEGDDNVCVCDIFFSVGDKNIEKIITVVCQVGFRQYKSYHKLTVKNPKIEVVENNPKIKILQSADKDAVAVLYQYFDKYSDCLPRRIEFPQFIYEKKFLSLYDVKHQEFLGALIYTEKCHSIIEEFIYIQKRARGRGLSTFLSSYWYQMFTGLDVRFITWVRDDNAPSIALHRRYNYQDSDIKKITFLKG